MKLQAEHVYAGYHGESIVRDVSFQLESGEVLCLLGPNGVGKTTLFKSLLGFLPVREGAFLMDGEKLNHRDRKQLARLIGYIPQAHEPPFPFQVLDVVVMGCISRTGTFAGPPARHFDKAAEILETLGVSYLKDHVYTEISGGERQMVLIARALMQDPKFLVMDEPTSSLDFGNQMRVLRQIQRLAADGMGVVMTSHFPDHAFLCCTKAAIMCREEPFHMGPVEEIVTEESLRKAYGVEVRIIRTRDCGGIVQTCVPLLRSVDSGERRESDGL